MAGRRRRRRNPKGWAWLVLLVGAGASTWWVYRAERSTLDVDAGLILASQADPTTAPAGTGATQVSAENPQPAAAPPREPEPPEAPAQAPEPAVTSPDRIVALIDGGREAVTRQDRLLARTSWNEALRIGPDAEQERFLRTQLGRLADETILSPGMISDDPLVDRYVIRAGDVLAKVATANRISPDLLANINGLVDKNLIREGQTIKLLKGPFRAVVNKATYTLDVFLGDTFVRQYKVGLGADDSTPTGEWRVATKLVNPTYYPPRGGQIVSADDPANPLGERWIGLIGVAGEAVDQQRYGIHGTSEPDSIGKSVSMGCIRMHNSDVEQLYTFLVEVHSTVMVLE